MMRAAVSGLGVALALAFMALSATINWRYGQSLGRDGIDQAIYSTASVLCDIGKALSPFFLWWAWERRRVLHAAMSCAFWLTCTAYSLSSAAGFIELNRTIKTGAASSNRGEAADLERAIERKQAQIERLGAATPARVIAAKLSHLQTDPKWIASKQCTEVRTRLERTFCDEVAAQVTKRERAVAIDRIEKELAELRVRLRELSTGATSKSGDTRVGLATRVFPIEAGDAELVLSLLFVIVLEIGSGFGLFIATSHGDIALRVRAMRSARDSTFGNVAAFARGCLVAHAGAIVTTAELKRRYDAWCEQTGSTPLDRGEFEATVERLAELTGIQHTSKAGGGLAGVAFASD